MCSLFLSRLFSVRASNGVNAEYQRVHFCTILYNFSSTQRKTVLVKRSHFCTHALTCCSTKTIIYAWAQCVRPAVFVLRECAIHGICYSFSYYHCKYANRLPANQTDRTDQRIANQTSHKPQHLQQMRRIFPIHVRWCCGVRFSASCLGARRARRGALYGVDSAYNPMRLQSLWFWVLWRLCGQELFAMRKLTSWNILNICVTKSKRRIFVLEWNVEELRWDEMRW